MTSNMKWLASSFLSRLRKSELKLAKSILRWKLERDGHSLPESTELDAAAAQLLDEARKIARRRGKNLYDVLKEGAKDFFNAKH